MNEENQKIRFEELENQLGMLQDIQAIRKLHHMYGYFIDKCMYEEAVDCFADDCEFHFFRGIYRGKTGIRRAYCDKFRERFTGGKNGPVFGFLLDHPMMQDVVDVAPDRQTAEARFRCLMMAGTQYEKDPKPSNVARQWWEGALYENTYVRIGGVWKIKVLNYRPVWHATFEDGWAYTPPKFVPMAVTTYPADPLGPDEIADYEPCLWPDHEVMPFHCAHPVTGKPIVTPEPGINTRKKDFDPVSTVPTSIKKAGDTTMSPTELEAEVLRLRNKIEEGSKAKDYLEIWQLMSTYSHLYHVFKRSEVPNLFAQKTPGVEVEIEDSGVYEGLEGVRRVFCGILADDRHKVPGFLGIHMTCNPVIEMNNVRTEAKGLWHSHGSVTLNQTGQLTSYWCLGKYDMTFVKEEGQWKILKMRYRLTYMTPYEKGWVEESQGASITAAHASFPPDRPSTYHMPYNPHRVNVFQPLPPEPFEESPSTPHMESAIVSPSVNVTLLPSHDELVKILKSVVGTKNGGFELNMWATVVDRDGIVKAVVFSGNDRGDQWPGSRVISAQKANTANAFSLPELALSTANLYSAVQPGGSLFGLQHSNPVNTEVAYRGIVEKIGTAEDPMVGGKIGGINVFGGGLPLYNSDGKLIGALGVSGDSSCADHNIAWKVRHGLGLDYIPSGVGPDGDDNIIYDITNNKSASGWGHPVCDPAAEDVAKRLPGTSSVTK